MGKLEISELVVASGKQFAVGNDGCVPGAFQYTDREYTFDCIPEIVLGATHIRTAGNDKNISEHDECFRFHVDRPVTVYVVYSDKLRVLPCWLGDYVDTREKVTRTDSNTSTLKGIFTLFAKDFPAGLIRLNGNLADQMKDDRGFLASGGTNYCMYSVVVKKRTVEQAGCRRRWPVPHRSTMDHHPG